MAINQLIMKIYEYDEPSNSIIVAFKSDQSIKSIDEYPRLAYQPTMFEDADTDTIIKNIAITGVSVAEAQDRQDTFKQNESVVNEYKAKIGQEITYNLSDLIPPPPLPEVLSGQ
jgi:hypothetical protein